MIGRRTPLGDAQHWKYRARPGSDFVASGFAIDAVVRLVADRRPATILEVGAGIGTLTEAILDARERASLAGTQVAVEGEPFCLAELDANLGERLADVTVVPLAADVPASVGPYDLVVIDGGSVEDLLPVDRHRWTPDDERAEVAAWIDRLAPRAVVIVENVRSRQRAHLEALATRPFVHEHLRPLDATPGYHRYRFDPTSRERLAARARDRIRDLWFPRGYRAAKRAHRAILRRPLAPRTAVAPGDPAYNADAPPP